MFWAEMLQKRVGREMLKLTQPCFQILQTIYEEDIELPFTVTFEGNQ